MCGIAAILQSSTSLTTASRPMMESGPGFERIVRYRVGMLGARLRQAVMPLKAEKPPSPSKIAK